jgi:zinc transport system substrate-binding protein
MPRRITRPIYFRFTPSGCSGTISQQMKKIRRSNIFLSLAFCFICGAVYPAAVPTKQLCIAATIFPVVDIVRHVAGPDMRVIQILPAGASPHTFDLTPGKVRELQKARVIFKIGVIDDWIDGVAESLPRAAIISLQKGITLQPSHEQGHGHGAAAAGHDDFDPHYWLSAANGVVMARNIAAALSAADPARAAVYDRNYRGYASELAAVHEEIKKELSALKSNKMIVFHDGWRYFAAAYGLEIAAVFQASPGREPTPRDMQELYAQVRRYGIGTVFSEPQLPTSSLEPLLQDLGLKLVVIDPLGGTVPGESYAGLLRRDARAILGALGR